jgi:hypothetical protein
VKRSKVAIDVAKERGRHDRLLAAGKIEHDCADPTVPPEIKLPVLLEEVGEVAIAMNDNEPLSNLRTELIQVAAVASAWAESLS